MNMAVAKVIGNAINFEVRSKNGRINSITVKK